MSGSGNRVDPSQERERKCHRAGRQERRFLCHALAESVIGLHKTELIRNRGRCRSPRPGLKNRVSMEPSLNGTSRGGSHSGRAQGDSQRGGDGAGRNGDWLGASTIRFL